MAVDSDRLREGGIGSQASRPSEATRWGLLITGVLLIEYGVYRGSLLGLLSTAAGAGLLYLGLTQESTPQRIEDLSTPAESGGPEAAVAESVVDEASWESFPASDAPAY
ncbi:MAG: hypothetical protein ABFD16_15515 [Thermoguttaceae bacterium]|jgi:uncharacterized membrane protein